MLKSMRKMFRDNSKTCGTLETPFLLRATQRYVLIAEMKMSSVLNTGPECWRMDKSNSSDRILERSSCDLHTSRVDTIYIYKHGTAGLIVGETISLTLRCDARLLGHQALMTGKYDAYIYPVAHVHVADIKVYTHIYIIYIYIVSIDTIYVHIEPHLI